MGARSDADDFARLKTGHFDYRGGGSAQPLRSIRDLINRKAPRQEQFEFIESHPIIRSISEYGSLVRRALRNELAPCICRKNRS